MNTQLILSAFTTFFVIIDPPGCIPIFASLTAGGNAAYVRTMAYRSVLVAGGILITFALVGAPMLKLLGISLDAFRIAGGLMLFMIALDMVFERRTERRQNRADNVKAADLDDISVFPMGMPMIAGPGSIASVMLATVQAGGWLDRSLVLGALVVVLLMTLGCLLAAAPLMRLLGTRVEAVITRILGVLLAALAAQFVIDGVRNAFHLA